LTGTAPNLVAGNVTINYFNNTNSTYQMLWGAGTGLYMVLLVFIVILLQIHFIQMNIVAFAASDRG
jgi:hypothetical protein